MADQETRYTGTVKFYNRLKRYGFVVPEGQADENAVFFHSTDAFKRGFLMPVTGEVFTYTLVDHEGRQKAANIERPNAPEYVSRPRPVSDKPAGEKSATDKPKFDKTKSDKPAARRTFRKTSTGPKTVSEPTL